MDNITNSFNRGRDGDLVNTSFLIIESVTDNTYFLNPIPALADIKKAAQEYQAALYDAAGRDQRLVSIKNDKRAVLRALLSQLAEYVSSVAKGERTVLLSSGFSLTKAKGEVATLKPIDKLMVSTETPEQAVISVKKVNGAKAYIHQYTTGAVTSESQWVSRTITEPWCTFTGLQPGVKYAFRVIAIGPGEQSVYSPIVSRFIQ
jgi:hypothetical protein